MNKTELKKPILICLYGFPGSGKSYVAANLAKNLRIAHVSVDIIRSELFRNSSSPQSSLVASKIALYQTKEFLSSGVGVIYDGSAMNIAQRKYLRDLATKNKSGYMLIWLQIDSASAFARAARRDKRTLEGKYNLEVTKDNYNKYVASMQNPKDEDYLVISGKHSFNSQKSVIISKLYQMGYIGSSDLTGNVTKPELVNLVPSMPRPLDFETREF